MDGGCTSCAQPQAAASRRTVLRLAGERNRLARPVVPGIDLRELVGVAVGNPDRASVDEQRRRAEADRDRRDDLSLAGSTRETVPSRPFATHTAPEPTATASGSFSEGYGRCTPLRGWHRRRAPG